MGDPSWGVSLEIPQCPCVLPSAEYHFLGDLK